MGYEIRGRDSIYGEPDAEGALARALKLVRQGETVYVFDQYGDPVGMAQLEREIEEAKNA